MGDSAVIPFQRQRFHDRIREEQAMCDKVDGKFDNFIKVSSNEEVNLLVTDALIRRVNDLRDFVETSSKVTTNNEKIRQLNYRKIHKKFNF